MPAVNMLTEARHGLWNAIDNWPGLTGKFARKIRFDKAGDAPNGMVLPQPGECPAIGIFPLPSTDSWETNQSRQMVYRLNVSLFTYHLILPIAEDLFCEVQRALWNCKPQNSTLEYYRQSGYVQDMRIPNVAPVPVKTDPENRSSPDVIRWDLMVELDLNWHPSMPIPVTP